MDAPKLGQLITDDQHRDAIHIAVCPMVALEKLWPAQTVGLAKGSTGEAVAADAPRVYSAAGSRIIKTDTAICRSSWGVAGIGIVDPFLKEPVEPGQKFWMFLYPGTITSLRHEWSHPAFAPAPKNTSAAEQVVSEYAEMIGMSARRIMEAATEYADSGEYCFMGDNEEYKGVGNWERFWRAWEEITGRRLEENQSRYIYRGNFFSCSC